MQHVPIEETEMFGRYVAVANWAWSVATAWPQFARDTIGIQLVKAADSVGANLVEGDGRYSAADSLRFLYIARGSAREARYWIQRAVDRGLLTGEAASPKIVQLTGASQLLNKMIRYRRDRGKWDQVKEQTTGYLEDEDPFNCDLDQDYATLWPPEYLNA